MRQSASVSDIEVRWIHPLSLLVAPSAAIGSLCFDPSKNKVALHLCVGDGFCGDSHNNKISLQLFFFVPYAGTRKLPPVVLLRWTSECAWL